MENSHITTVEGDESNPKETTTVVAQQGFTIEIGPKLLFRHFCNISDRNEHYATSIQWMRDNGYMQPDSTTFTEKYMTYLEENEAYSDTIINYLECDDDYNVFVHESNGYLLGKQVDTPQKELVS